MALIGSIALGMSADVGGLEQDLAKAESVLKRWKAPEAVGGDAFRGLRMRAEEISGAFNRASGVVQAALGQWKVGALAAAGAAATASAGLVKLAFDALKAADDVFDLADRLGTTGGALVQMQYVAKLTGTDVEAMGMAIQRLSANLGSAGPKGEKATAVLTRIGLSAKDLRKLDPSEAMVKIIENFSRIPDQAGRAAAAMDLFGKAGLGIIGTLSIGSERVRELVAESEGLREAFGGRGAQAIGEANDALDKLSFAWKGLTVVLAKELAPVVTNAMTTMTEWLKEASKEGSTLNNIFSFITDSLHVMVETLKLIKPLTGIDALGALLAKEQRFPGEAKALAPPVEPPKPPPALDEALVEAMSKADDLRNSLELDIKTFGMTKDAVELYKLELDGVDAATRSTIQGLINQKSALEANKKHVDALKDSMKTWADQAKSVYEAARTPIQKYNDELAKLESLLAKGLITQQTFDQARKNALDERMQALAKVENQPKLARNLEFGSAEAYTAIVRAQAGGRGDPMKDSLKVQKDQLQVQKETLRVLNEKAAASLSLDVVTV